MFYQGLIWIWKCDLDVVVIVCEGEKDFEFCVWMLQEYMEKEIRSLKDDCLKEYGVQRCLGRRCGHK